MRFVTHRPALTVGSTVPGFPEVQSVLYADGESELYLLDRDGNSNLLLIRVIATDINQAPPPESLSAWISSHGGQNVTRCVSTGSDAEDSQSYELVLRIGGKWMADIPTLPLQQDELYALLTALVDLSLEAARADLRAVPERPLLWISGPTQTPRVSSIYVRKGPGSDTEVVHEIAQTFLWSAMGISSTDMESVPDEDRLRSWCQHADADLSRIIARCFDPQQPITDLTQLKLEVEYCRQQIANTARPDELSTDRYFDVGPKVIGRVRTPRE
jgi:hypothetical protein